MEANQRDILHDDFVFTNDIYEAFSDKYLDHVAHIFIHKGGVEFRQDDKIYNADSGYCLIMPSRKPVKDIKCSDDLSIESIIVSNRYFSLNLPKSHYNIIGLLSMLENPVLAIDPSDVATCLRDIERIKERLSQCYHTFNYNTLSREVDNFVFDLYDVHARGLNRIKENVSQSTIILQKFIELLNSGMYRDTRKVEDYANKIFISSKYLSEACVKASGHNASYWIERHTMESLSRDLKDTDKSLIQLVDEYNFSSLSHFSKYVKNATGKTPTQFKGKNNR